MLHDLEIANTCIRVVGLGYVGLPLAISLADLGLHVHAVERRADVIAGLRNGQSHINEPGLASALQRVLAHNRLTLSQRIADGPRATIQIITVGTPLNDAGKADFSMIEAVCAELADTLAEGDLVILRSTVRVGVTRNTAKPILDRAGVGYDLAFCPERLSEGRAMEELASLPQIVGSIGVRGQLRAAQLFQLLTPTVVRVSQVETAEMVKLVNNTQRDVLFGYVNEIAAVCDRLKLSAAEVIASANLGYPRSNLAYPGPVGGACLSKDPYILNEVAEAVGMPGLDLIQAARRVNESQPLQVAAFIADWLADKRVPVSGNLVLAMLGIAFKGDPVTDDVRGTLVVPLLAALRAGFPQLEARGCDAETAPDVIAGLGFVPQADMLTACNGAHLVIMANRHPAIGRLDITEIADVMSKPGLIYDLWSRHRNPPPLVAGIRYCGLGEHWRMDSGDTP